jgi:hypothetical protein
MYSINQSTGALTSITTAVAAGSGPINVAVDPSGRFAYVTNNSSASVSMYSIQNSGFGDVTATSLKVTGGITSTSTYTESSRSTAMGYWTTPTFSAGNFAGLASMTWTVAGQTTYEYTLVGKTMTLNFYITGTIGGTPASGLTIKIPGSYTAASRVFGSGFYYDNGVWSNTPLNIDTVAAGSSVIQLYKGMTVGNWTTGTNYVEGSITFQVQ